jgi:hypothetical protein
MNLLFSRNAVNPVGCKRVERCLNKRVAVFSGLIYVSASPSGLEHNYCPDALHDFSLSWCVAPNYRTQFGSLAKRSQNARGEIPSENYGVRCFETKMRVCSLRRN